MNQSTLSKRIGEYLVEQGDVSSEQLSTALQEQASAGGLLGHILHSASQQPPIAIAKALASQKNTDFVDLLVTPPNPELLREKQIDTYLSLEALPYKKTADGSMLIAATDNSENVHQWAQREYSRYRIVLTTKRDIHRTLVDSFPHYFTALGVEKLWRNKPELSARQTVAYRQKLFILAILTFFFCSWLSYPSTLGLTLLFVVNGFYIATLLFKTILLISGAKRRHTVWQTSLGDRIIAHDRDLPVYTILVPLYDEAESLPHLLESLRRIDYPPSKLDIKLIIEADDHKTLKIAKALRPEGRFEILPVPYSLPRTKPKACNYALRFAKGELVTIYDAEDRPDPKQLRQVVQAFQNGPKNLICVQARLNYYNREQNWLTRLFAIEYAAWFDFMIPGLNSLNLPIPLGGTSNHISLKRLKELGEWDAYNVTEDADLGIRMASHKYITRVISSETLEEAPPSLQMWIKQRSRWIKGYMQTWLVHMRHPIHLWKQLGTRGFWGFQFFIGGPCLVFLSAPMLLLFSIYWLIFPLGALAPLYSNIFPIATGCFIYGLLLHFLFGAMVIHSRKWPNMTLSLVVFPFYWLLHSVASFRALHQLLTRPHYWDKTSHGHSTVHNT